MLELNQTHIGDCRDLTEELDDESVQLVVTSPPYWGLRDYGLEPVVWDGDPECQHIWGNQLVKKTSDNYNHGFNERWGNSPGQKKQEASSYGQIIQGQFCQKCGAWKGCLGLEPTPDLYIKHMVDIFGELWRVLRKDGIVFLNIGDSYASGGRGGGEKGSLLGRKEPPPGLKHKDLCLIPERLAIALQQQGWWVRSRITWEKVNCMPESATDRPTVSDERIWMLTKSGTTTFWTHRDGRGTRKHPKPDYRWVHGETEEETDQEPGNWKESRIPCPECGGTGYKDVILETDLFGDVHTDLQERCERCKDSEDHTVPEWDRINLWKGHDYYYDQDAIREPQTGNAHSRGRGNTPKDAPAGSGIRSNDSFNKAMAQYTEVADGRNRRTVWSIPTQAYKGAHFATFPTALVEPMVLVGSSPKACPECGAPWARGRKKVGEFQRRWSKGNQEGSPYNAQDSMQNIYDITDFHPTCDCEGNDGSGRCVVLDPFMGSGTTGAEAKRRGRDWMGMEANPAYKKLADKRTGVAQQMSLFVA